MADWRDRLKATMDERGMSMRTLSTNAGLGATFVRDALLRDREPSLTKFVAIAKALDVSVDWLIGGEGDRSPDRLPSTAIIPGSALLGTGTMPVYAAGMGGDGHIIVTFDEIDRVKRPAELENVKGGYGLLIKGSSMTPAINEGDMALVNPHLPPSRGANVILYHTPPHGGDVEAMVKHLLSWNDREWSLKQWNPMKEFKEYRQEWPICHRVVGIYYAR